MPVVEATETFPNKALFPQSNGIDTAAHRPTGLGLTVAGRQTQNDLRAHGPSHASAPSSGSTLQHFSLRAPIISRLIVSPRSGNSWGEIEMFASITPQPTPPGSTKLRSGFPKSSVMSSLAASSSRLKILIGNSSATSVATTKRPNPLSGLTPKPIGPFAPPRNQCNAALVWRGLMLLTRPYFSCKEIRADSAKPRYRNEGREPKMAERLVASSLPRSITFHTSNAVQSVSLVFELGSE